ncbi:MAG: hypothetical protein ACXVEX_13280 [Actinomycetota bacterium]
MHAVLGGIVMAAIANGMGLLGLSAAVQYTSRRWFCSRPSPSTRSRAVGRATSR